MKKAIIAGNISYSYNGKVAVDHVSFDVAPGQILGFLGPNGAGKTTALKMLIGLSIPESGKITILGFDAIKDRKSVQPRIGVCFEEKNLYEEMSAAENLNFFASLFGINKFDPSPLLKRVDLPVERKDSVMNYSKGMKQRLMVARALVNQPEVLFLDEPTDGLDPISAEAIRTVILEEKENGAAIFLTTHDMMEADRISDNVAFISDGKIATIDTPENLKHRFGKRILEIRYRIDDTIYKEDISLDEKDMASRIAEIASAHAILDMHTEEATLEDIFIRFTGRKL